MSGRVEFTWRKLDRYPGEIRARHERKKSSFSATWGSTVRLLEREIAALGGREGELSIALDERYFRRDGLPRADAPKVDPPAIVLTIVGTRYGELIYACDAFLDWRDNVRAIGLTLERLRRAGTYGVARGEQYRGWRRLPEQVDSRSIAAGVLAGFAGVASAATLLALDEAGRRTVYRQALKTVHPDHGGNADDLAKVLRAGELLGVA